MKVKVLIQQTITHEVEIDVEATNLDEAHEEVAGLNLGEYIEDGKEVGQDIFLYSLDSA